MALAKYNAAEHKRHVTQYAKDIESGHGWCVEPICLVEQGMARPAQRGRRDLPRRTCSSTLQCGRRQQATQASEGSAPDSLEGEQTQDPNLPLHTHRQKKRGPLMSLSLADIAANGSKRELLEALRDHIANQLDAGVPPHTLAPLTNRLMDIAKELEALASAEGGDDLGAAAGTPDAEFDPEAL
jgi:hypothetical protein